MSKPLPTAILIAEDRTVCGSARPKRADATPRPPSRHTSLAFEDARDLINAFAYCEQLLPNTPWAHITMVLAQSAHDVAGGRQYLALQRRILTAIRDWLKEKQLPAHHIWVREIGKYGAHSHILLPIPPEHRQELADVIRRAGRLHDLPNNRAVVITPEKNRWTGEADTKGLHTAAQRAGVLRDMVKTLSRRARLDGVRIIDALGIRHRAACTIAGKRSGVSQSLSRAARERARWRELKTLPELRAILTAEGAQKERNRVNQRRYRTRRKAGIAPMPWPPTRRSRPVAVPEPDPFAAINDLALDFLEAEEVIELDPFERLLSR